MSSPRSRPVPLTEREWGEVFRLRCRAKRGERIDKGEQKLVDRAWREDEKRYTAMEADVFDATVPFGSSVRARRGT